MWTAFMPDDAPRANEFSDRLQAVLGDREISTATLQYYFVTQRRATADEIIAQIELVAQQHGERLSEAETPTTKLEE